jgi:cell division protein FtsB
MKKRRMKLRFKLLILACFLAYTGFSIYTQQINIGQLQAKQEVLALQYEQVQTDLSRLQYKSEYMHTEKYVEEKARERFGLMHDGEIMFETKAGVDN